MSGLGGWTSGRFDVIPRPSVNPYIAARYVNMRNALPYQMDEMLRFYLNLNIDEASGGPLSFGF